MKIESYLIKNATVITSCKTYRSDVFVRNGKIEEIGSPLYCKAAKVIDATGLHLIPGVIDPQVHFREPGFTWKEDIESGSRGCAKGGITSFFEMPNTNPSTTTIELMEEKKQIASNKSVVNYNFFIGATEHNIDVINQVKNVPGIKVFMGSSTGSLLVNDFGALDFIFGHGNRLIAVHAEDEDILNYNKSYYSGRRNPEDHYVIRSAEAALRATQKAVQLSKCYKRRLHILHLTTKEEVAFLSRHKTEYISTEVSPQHLCFFGPDIYRQIGTLAQMNPPIRTIDHTEMLWRGIRSGVIDCIATDHAPHTLEEKGKPFGQAPSGMPGVETSLSVMLTFASQGMCTYQDVVKWMCEKPSELYGVSHKGRIETGYDADLVLIDLEKKHVITGESMEAKVKWSPFEGLQLKGCPVMTFVNGNLVYQEGDLFTDIKGREVAINAPWEIK